MHFRTFHLISGLFVFTVSLIVYLLTLEQSVSFWDCGEFIACAYRLEVGHQPGAPLFLLLGRISTLFASDPSRVALMVNALSALASALTVFFLYASVCLLVSKLFSENKKNLSSMIIIYGSGIIGSLAFAFTDTFWFSAVEGEVYATSSLFTAVVFWAMLRWESEANEPHAERWIFLIIFLMGLSIGVHLLNLLCIPALVLINYYKKHKPTPAGTFKALLVSFLLLGAVVFIFIPWIIKLAAWFDLLFVNVFGLPINSGALTYLALLIAVIIILIRFSHNNKKPILNKIIMAFALLLAGYSSYLVLTVRADANPPINMNRVNNPFALLQYINREQYVSRPLVYGPYYNTPITGIRKKYTMVPEDGKYTKKEINSKYTFDRNHMTIFPRMSSMDPADISAYKRWTGRKNNDPDFSDNLYYFFRYQVGYMYLRYFMWNFAGRQTENQGTGDVMNGNWISGISFIDALRLGPQEKYPMTLKSNRGRNAYYFLPLILGIAGLYFQYKARRRDFTVVMLFFLMTGLATVIYLNEIPATPRERDYAVGGSFYVFCIWIGLGVAGLYHLIRKKIPLVPAALIAISASTVVPVILLFENYDDHDRSGRFIARDFASDYLNSCAPEAILFTNADNDTYPLWYAQEVEGIRQDVRVVLAPFLTADWYIEKLGDWQNKAQPVTLTITPQEYSSGALDYILCYKRTDKPANLRDLIAFIKSNDPRTFVKTNENTRVHYYPTNRVYIPVKNDTTEIHFSVSDHALARHLIVILDIIASNNWERPIYFLSTQVPEQLGLADYLQLDGFAYRLVPEKFDTQGYAGAGSIDTDILYENLMNRFSWGNMNDQGIFMDFNSIRTTNVLGIRNTFARLAEELTLQNKMDKANEVLDRCMMLMPHESVPYDVFVLRIIAAYLNAGNMEKAGQILTQYEVVINQELEYYQSLKPTHLKGLEREAGYTQYISDQIQSIKSRL